MDALTRTQQAIDELQEDIRQGRLQLTRRDAVQLTAMKETLADIRNLAIRLSPFPAEELSRTFGITTARISQIRNRL
jgi:hypothetical protein